MNEWAWTLHVILHFFFFLKSAESMSNENPCIGFLLSILYMAIGLVVLCIVLVIAHCGASQTTIQPPTNNNGRKPIMCNVQCFRFADPKSQSSILPSCSSAITDDDKNRRPFANHKQNGGHVILNGAVHIYLGCRDNRLLFWLAAAHRLVLWFVSSFDHCYRLFDKLSDHRWLEWNSISCVANSFRLFNFYFALLWLLHSVEPTIKKILSYKIQNLTNSYIVVVSIFLYHHNTIFSRLSDERVLRNLRKWRQLTNTRKKKTNGNVFHQWIQMTFLSHTNLIIISIDSFPSPNAFEAQYNTITQQTTALHTFIASKCYADYGNG